jgi:hypothetical protein
LPTPRILVAGLNPHAGEGGYLGREEIEIITPVLDKLRAEGMRLSGPHPADTMFTPPVLEQGDAVLAMYHDQGLTALKYATFGHGINVTLGLPDHPHLGRSRHGARTRRQRPRRPGQPVRGGGRSGRMAARKAGADERPRRPQAFRAKFSGRWRHHSAIVSAIDPQRGDTVVEIGPGLGAITEPCWPGWIICMSSRSTAT